MTVSRIPQLIELSALLGVDVLDVDRDDGRGGRRWFLRLAAEPDAWTFPLPSRVFRCSGDLTRQLWLWGRDPRRPLVTTAEGRRCLRLMHEHYEMKESTT